MAKFDIHTYSNIEVNHNGTTINVPVNKIYSELDNVPNITKTVNSFNKYSSKKNLNVACKHDNKGLGIER